MNKHFSSLLVLLVVAFFLLPDTLFAGASTIFRGQMHVIYPDYSEIREPFIIQVTCPKPLPSKQQMYDVTLSENIELLEGDLHWEHEGKLTQSFKHELKILFKKRGFHQISLEYNYKQLSNKYAYLENRNPQREEFFAYVGRDTVVWSRGIEDLQTHLRQGRFGSALHCSFSFSDNFTSEDRRRKIVNKEPSMLETAGTEEIGFFCLDPDADINRWNLFEHFPEYKEDAILQHKLLISQPVYKRLEMFFIGDWLLGVSEEFKEKMSNRLQRQISELYKMDQQILSITDSLEFSQALDERAVILKKQLKARRYAVEKEKQQNIGIEFDNFNR